LVVTRARWYARREGDGITLRKPPRLASWNKATDPDQVRLREYLDDTVELLAPATMIGSWTLMLDVGLPAGRDLIDMADLSPKPFVWTKTAEQILGSLQRLLQRTTGAGH
jgi:hypothetical protein